MPFCCCMSRTNWAPWKAQAAGLSDTCSAQRSMRCWGVASSGSLGSTGYTTSCPQGTPEQVHSSSVLPQRAQWGSGMSGFMCSGGGGGGLAAAEWRRPRGSLSLRLRAACEVPDEGLCCASQRQMRRRELVPRGRRAGSFEEP